MVEVTTQIPGVHWLQSPQGADFGIAMVSLNVLQIDRYQRDLDQVWVNKIVRDWKEDEVRPLTLSYRGGILYIVNGNHTRYAAALREKAGLLAQVFFGKTYEQEADWFDRLNSNSDPVDPFERFNARVEAGDKDAVLVRMALDHYGFVLTRTRTSELRRIRGVAAVLDGYKAAGPELFERALALIGGWADSPSGSEGGMMGSHWEGLLYFLAGTADTLDMDRMVSILQYKTPDMLRSDVSRDAERLIRRVGGAANGTNSGSRAMMARDVWLKWYNRGGPGATSRRRLTL